MLSNCPACSHSFGQCGLLLWAFCTPSGSLSGLECLQDRVKELENEIEWVRAERQDAQQAAQREQKQAQARVKEAEDAASRAKAARRLATTSCGQTSHLSLLYLSKHSLKLHLRSVCMCLSAFAASVL